MKTAFPGLLAAAMLLVLLGFGTACGQSLTFDRATTCASGDGYYGWGPNNVVVDAQGNTYVTGSFNGTVTLGSTVLTATQTPPGRTLASDNFVAKLDAAGQYVWAVQMADNQSATVGGLAVDAAGDVYVTGSFDSYSLRFGASGFILYNSSADGEGFIAKLSGVTGQWLWARRVGGTGFDGLGSIVVNAAGDLYVAGGTGSAVADMGPFTLNGPQGFLAKLNPNGTWLWVRPVGNAQSSVLNLLIDAQGGLYLAGLFQGPSVSFGATTLTTQGVPGSPYPTRGRELFVAKTDDAGNWLWAVQGDAVAHMNLVMEVAACLDGGGHLYAAGYYASTSARIGGTVLPNLSGQYPPPVPAPPVPYTNNYYTDAYVARLNTTTGAWDWAVRSGGPSGEGARGIVADVQGRAYVMGTLDRTTLGADLTQVAQIDGATGLWRSMQSMGPLSVFNLALDGQSRLHWAGFFNSATAQFGPVTLAQAGPGQSTGFVARMGAGPLAAYPSAGVKGRLAVWPNPSESRAVWVQGPAPDQLVQVLDVLGRVVSQGRMPATGPWPLAGATTLPAGLYVVRGGGQAARLVIER